VGPVLGNAGVVDDPGRDPQFGAHPLGAGAHEQRRIPGRVGQELLQALIAGGILPQTEEGGPKTLATSVLYKAADIEKGVVSLANMRESRHHLLDEDHQALTHVRRRRLCGRAFLHVPLLRTMTVSTDPVRYAGEGTSINLTKYY
jgi:hypothetical protein